MKKILIALVVVLCSVQIAGAQGKSVAAVRKNVESAEAEVANPKKAENVASWIKLGNAYMDAYTGSMGAGWVGAGHSQMDMVIGEDKPTSTEDVTLGGQHYTKEVFATKNYYYDSSGILQIIEVMQPIYEDALLKALDAFKKAYEVDLKAVRTKDIKKALEDISEMFRTDAFQKYILNDMVGACKCFENASIASEQAPLCVVDSLSIYNTGFIAAAIGDFQKSKEFFEKSIEVGYHEKGETFAKLADTYVKLGDSDKAIEVLETGFMRYPENQAILVGLIGIYLDNNQNPEKLLGYIAQAKANEPNNASLYYVEGCIYDQLGDRDKAIAAFNETIGVNPDYEYGYIGMGLVYYNLRAEIVQIATLEEDDLKYAQLVEQFNEASFTAAEYLEKAFETTKSDEVKFTLAQYLNEIYFRYREEEKYKASFEKYNAMITNNGL